VQRLRYILIVILLIMGQTCLAHESRPIFVKALELSPNQFMLTVKIPRGGLTRGKLHPVFDKSCQAKEKSSVKLLGHASISNQLIHCSQGLRGTSFYFNSLEKNLGLSVHVHIEFLDGSNLSQLLLPTSPSFSIPEIDSKWGIFKSYTHLGIKHILEGFDHLLFVLCLLIIVKSTKKLVLTVTGFTLAHSITLSLAALSFFSLPSTFVETSIALSIVFLAAEIVKNKRDSLIYSHPVIIAFVFGLLHGFGFADVLLSLGLPHKELLISLVAFNLGVEIGQLLFIVICLSMAYCLRRIPHKNLLLKSNNLLGITIGSIAAFWTIERFSQIIA
jgi:hydrogenase/urease accessory protein HupE